MTQQDFKQQCFFRAIGNNICGPPAWLSQVLGCGGSSVLPQQHVLNQDPPALLHFVIFGIYVG